MPPMTFKRGVFLFVALLVCAGTGQPAKAGSQVNIVAQNIEPLVISDSEDSPETGILADLFDIAARKSGVSTSVVKMPTKRGLAIYRAGKADAIVFLVQNGLEQHSARSLPLIPVNRIYIVRRTVPFSGPADAKNLTTGIMLGTSINVIPAKYRPDADKVIKVPSVDQMASLVQRGRFDAVVGSDLFIYYYLEKIDKGPDYIHEPVLLQKSAIALHIGPGIIDRPEWQRFTNALESVLNTPEYREVMRRYLGRFADVLG